MERAAKLGKFLCVAGVVFLACAAFGQKTDLGALAARTAASIEKSRKKSVVVMTFVGADGATTDLGKLLADEFGAALANHAKGFDVIGRPALAEKTKEGTERYHLDRKLAVWYASLVSAEAVVTGRIVVSGEQLELMLEVYDVAKGRRTAELNGPVARTEEIDSLLRNDLDKRGPGAYARKLLRRPFPECMRCPPPDISGIKGAHVVLVRLQVTEAGKPSQLSVVRGVSPELDALVLEAVQGWKFKPALGSNGKPVATWLTIEVRIPPM